MFSTKFEPGRADLSGSSGFMVPTGNEGGRREAKVPRSLACSAWVMLAG